MARSVRRSSPVQLARQPEIEVCVMPAKDPQNTGLKNGQGNRPASTQSSAGKAACSPFPVTDPSPASDSHKMTYRHSATCCTEDGTQKHKNPALILEPVFNQASNEEFGAEPPNGADAPQWKGRCARGAPGHEGRSILARCCPKWLGPRHSKRKTEVFARAADSQQRKLRGA